MIYRRQRLLLGLIDFLNKQGRLDRLTLMKSMFLISQEIPLKFAIYHFHPYKYGPFSAKLYQELNLLERAKFLKINNKSGFNNINNFKDKRESSDSIEPPYKLTQIGKNNKEFPYIIKKFLEDILKKYKSLEDLIDFIYLKYPSFTCLSERYNIPIKYQRDKNPGFFLIGYERKDIDTFLKELIINNIEILVDIRANPRSMKFDFNGSRLNRFIEKIGIKYIHIPELGIVNEDRKNLKTDLDYQKLFLKYRKELSNKEEYLQKIIKLGSEHRTALMCYEKDPNYCHRGQIGEVLMKRGFDVNFI